MPGIVRKPHTGHAATMKASKLLTASTVAMGMACGQYSSHSPENFLMYLTQNIRYAAISSQPPKPASPTLNQKLRTQVKGTEKKAATNEWQCGSAGKKRRADAPIELGFWAGGRVAVHDHLEDLGVDGKCTRDNNPQERVQLLQNVLQPLVHLGLSLVGFVVVETILVIGERPQLHGVVSPTAACRTCSHLVMRKICFGDELASA